MTGKPTDKSRAPLMLADMSADDIRAEIAANEERLAEIEDEQSCIEDWLRAYMNRHNMDGIGYRPSDSMAKEIRHG